jgi:hypothetical protein
MVQEKSVNALEDATRYRPHLGWQIYDHQPAHAAKERSILRVGKWGDSKIIRGGSIPCMFSRLSLLLLSTVVSQRTLPPHSTRLIGVTSRLKIWRVSRTAGLAMHGAARSTSMNPIWVHPGVIPASVSKACWCQRRTSESNSLDDPSLQPLLWRAESSARRSVERAPWVPGVAQESCACTRFLRSACRD